MKVHIKKVYAKHPLLPHGMEAWLQSDTEHGTIWVRDRNAATMLEKEEAGKLLPELRRNRPDDSYEIVPLD